MTFYLLDDELPVLTDKIGSAPLADELPVLTEPVPDDAMPAPAVAMPAAAVAMPSMGSSTPATHGTLSGDEMVRLLQQLETHLESVFAQKLNSQLEHLQRLAVDLAISEFKAELPQLLHDALIEYRTPDSRR